MTEKKKTKLEQNFTFGPDGEIIKNDVILPRKRGTSPAPLLKKERIKTNVKTSDIDQSLGQDLEIEINQDPGHNSNVDSGQESDQALNSLVNPDAKINNKDKLVGKKPQMGHLKASKLSVTERDEEKYIIDNDIS
jgi:hypothetical protein